MSIFDNIIFDEFTLLEGMTKQEYLDKKKKEKGPSRREQYIDRLARDKRKSMAGTEERKQSRQMVKNWREKKYGTGSFEADYSNNPAEDLRAMDAIERHNRRNK